MLFKAYPGSDLIKVIWMIPARELWGQYQKGFVTQNDTVLESINDFQFNRDKLEMKEDDDLSDDAIYAIYTSIAHEAKTKKMMKASDKIKEYVPGIKV